MKLISSLLLSSSMLFLTQAALAQSSLSENAEHIVLGGYDLVAYHNVHAAVRGSSEFKAENDGQIFYFSNAENLKTFEQNPNAYLPAYGGFCAFAMAMKGAKVPADPETFKLRNGRLYLFFNDYYEGKPFNTIIPWNGAEQEMLSKADANWTLKNDLNKK